MEDVPTENPSPAQEIKSQGERLDKPPHPGSRSSFLFLLRTLWLFTQSDLKSMVYPNVIFGFSSAMAGSVMTTNERPNVFEVLANLPYVTIWLWLNLLLFNVANQRLPSSIIEDEINKPWRPLPSGRLNTTQAKSLLFVLIPTVLVCSLFLGATTQVLLLMVLTWMYNDLGGGDENFFVRNLLNAFGMCTYGSGAIVIASGSGHGLTPTGFQWLALIWMTIMTTLQVQDLKDQEGDSMRGRKTLPLVLGDDFTRWTIAMAVLGWSAGAPAFWKAGSWTFVPSLLIGSLLVFRMMTSRSVKADRGTWKLWCLWMITVYLMPLWYRLTEVDLRIVI